MRISDWSSDVCSSDLRVVRHGEAADVPQPRPVHRIVDADRIVVLDEQHPSFRTAEQQWHPVRADLVGRHILVFVCYRLRLRHVEDLYVVQRPAPCQPSVHSFLCFHLFFYSIPPPPSLLLFVLLPSSLPPP